MDDVNLVDLFVDEASGKGLLSIRREVVGEDPKDPLTVSRSAKEVAVAGVGCDRKLTLATK